MNFTVLDIVFSVIVLVFAFTAWRRGFVGEVLGKLAPVVSLLVAAIFFGDVAPLIARAAPIPPALLAVVSFVVLFVVAFVLLKILQAVLGGVINAIDVLKVNKILGLGLGVIEGLLVVSAVMIVMLCLPFDGLHTTVRQGVFWNILGGIVQQPTVKVQEFLHSAKASVSGLA